MAANQEILREYLLTLGFKVDQRSEKTITNSIIKADLTVKGLLKTLQSAAAAVYELTTGFAKSMEQLYFASKKAGTTISALQQIEFGAQGVGLQAGEMTGALQRMAMTIRSNPGMTSFIKQFGVEVKGRTMDKIAVDLIAAWSKLPFYIGSQYASMLGISPDDYFLLSESLPKVQALAQLRAQMAKDAGLNVDNEATLERQYTQQLRTLEARLDILKQTLAVSLLPGVLEAMTRVDAVVSHIAKSLNENGAFGTLLKLLKNLGSVSFTGAATEFNRMAFGDSVADFLAHPFAGKPRGYSSSASGKVIDSSSEDLGAGMRVNNPGNIMADAAGTRLKTYGSVQDGLNAMAALLVRYQQRGLNTIRKIVSTYAPAAGAGNSPQSVAGYINDLVRRTGLGADDALNFSDPAVLAKYMAAAAAHEQGGRTGGLGMDNYLSAAKAALGQVVLQQQTTINVHGPDPAKTAALVAGEQYRINDRMVGGVVRDLAGGAR